MYRISMLNLRFFPDDTHDKHLCDPLLTGPLIPPNVTSKAPDAPQCVDRFGKHGLSRPRKRPKGGLRGWTSHVTDQYGDWLLVFGGYCRHISFTRRSRRPAKPAKRWSNLNSMIGTSRFRIRSKPHDKGRLLSSTSSKYGGKVVRGKRGNGGGYICI
ncbi:uncharacterized protein YALI1_F09056g [Yarrowia lipolytica]|uniref:Uncharacterized protein n=1 Tax=Yarrowia lipolytica TaxID=4952 RepID=A0A1D8NM83_YARLL|nr:hypothetical protein YALI1_F09056g [Yarrowia lipolytica]